MYKGVALIEEGSRTYEVQTILCESVRDVVREIAKLGKHGRIASCDVWVKVKKTWACVKSVVFSD